MNQHRRDIEQAKRTTMLVRHFNEAHETFIYPEAVILHTMELTDKDDKLREKENNYIIAMESAWPWGLNQISPHVDDCLDDDTEIENIKSADWFKIKESYKKCVNLEKENTKVKQERK